MTDLTWCEEGGEHAWVLWTELESQRIIVDCDTCQTEVYQAAMVIPDLIIGPLPVTAERIEGGIRINPRQF